MVLRFFVLLVGLFGSWGLAIIFSCIYGENDFVAPVFEWVDR